MFIRLYSIYDRVAEEAGPVFQAVNDGVARRQYRALLQQVTPVDMDSYKLYLIGEYDSDKLEIKGCPATEVLLQVKQHELEEQA